MPIRSRKLLIMEKKRTTAKNMTGKEEYQVKRMVDSIMGKGPQSNLNKSRLSNRKVRLRPLKYCHLMKMTRNLIRVQLSQLLIMDNQVYH